MLKIGTETGSHGVALLDKRVSIYNYTPCCEYTKSTPSLSSMLLSCTYTSTKDIQLGFNWLKWIFDTSSKLFWYIQPKSSKLGNQQDIDCPVHNLINILNGRDTSPQYKIAITVNTTQVIACGYHFSAHHSTVIDLATITLLLLLRV